MEKEVQKLVIDTATEMVEYLQELLPKASAELAEIFKNKEIPLAKRWELFEKTPDFFKVHDGWTLHIPGFEEISWLDDFYLERHQTMTTQRFFERIAESDELDNPDSIFCKLNMKLDEVKEFFLQENIGSWVEDW